MRALGLALGVFIGLGFAAWVWARPPVLPSVVETRLDLLAQEIYDVAAWARRIPYDFALPRIARSRIRSYVEDLDLDEQTRERVLARLDSRGFVDEVVPFALALRDVYMDPGDDVETFDSWLRRTFDRSRAHPGFEHSMFRWDAEEDEDDGGDSPPVFDSELAAQLVEFYDALYLREHGPAADLGDQLACARRDSDRARVAAAARVRPVLRKLLAGVRERVEPGGEIAASLDEILGDDKALDTVSLSVVHFLDVLVCRHYRIFATEILRQRQLREWMLAELDKPGGGRLWAFLELSQQRRHAVLTVVDGLQGHLVQSLAGGAAGDPFLRQVLAEYETGASARIEGAKAAPPQQIDFLRDIAVSGVTHDAYLPFFGRLYRQPLGIAAFGISTTPTISVRNLPIAKTGATVAGPGGTSIPNFHFVDRHWERPDGSTGRAYYFYGNDALQLEVLAEASGLQTLFSRLARRNTFSCAAQYDAEAHYRLDAFLNLALGEGVRDFGEVRCVAELRRRAAAQVELRDKRRRLLEKRQALTGEVSWFRFLRRSAQSDERKLAALLIDEIAALEPAAMPELLVYYNPWPDHFAHFTGPFADEILSFSGELNRLDYWLGAVEDTYRAAGISDRTLFAMAGDHGLTPVFQIVYPEKAVFERLRARGIDLKVVKISSDEGEGPKLTHPLDPPTMHGYDAVVASTAGGNYMIDFFADQGANWQRQPVLDELRELRLVDGGGPVDVVDEIARALADSLDYLVVRVTPCDVGGGEVALFGRRDGVARTARIARRGDRIFYESDGGDLLQLEEASPYARLSADQIADWTELFDRCVRRARREQPAQWCDESEWRRLTTYTPRPDSVVQLAHLYDSDRAGTVNLFPRLGVGYNTVVPGRHAGESFHEKDAFAGVWGEVVQRTARPRSAVIGSVPATVYAYLTEQEVAAGVDGWGYPSLALRPE